MPQTRARIDARPLRPAWRECRRLRPEPYAPAGRRRRSLIGSQCLTQKLVRCDVAKEPPCASSSNFFIPRPAVQAATISQYPGPPTGCELCYQPIPQMLIIYVICIAYGLSSEGDRLDHRSGSARSETHNEVCRPRAPTV